MVCTELLETTYARRIKREGGLLLFDLAKGLPTPWLRSDAALPAAAVRGISFERVDFLRIL